MESTLNKYMGNTHLGEKEIVNSKKKGSFLEWIIKRIFQTLGIYTTNKVVINKNQIDVFINIRDIKIVCECKQYEKNSKPIKSLIYEWSAKREEMECEKTLLVLWGYPKIEESDKKLAEKLNVGIWFDSKIEKFFNLILKDKEKARQEILLDLDLSLSELEEIKKKLIEELEKKLSGEINDSWKEEIFNCFKDGFLIDVFRYRSILNILKKRLIYLRATSWNQEPYPSGRMYVTIRRIEDLDIAKLEEFLKKERTPYFMSPYLEYVIDESGRYLVRVEEYFKEEIKKISR